MAKRIGPAKVKQYSLEFKLKAVQLSDQPGAANPEGEGRNAAMILFGVIPRFAN